MAVSKQLKVGAFSQQAALTGFLALENVCWG